MTIKRLLIYFCTIILLAVQFGCSTSGSATDTFMKTHDHNADGKISRDEYHRSFDEIDYNGDEHLDDGEIGSVLDGH